MLGGCRRGVAGCCVLCFPFCACVLPLTVCMLCNSFLCSGFFCAAPGAYSAFCLVLHRPAPLDVSKSLPRMAQQHHHENISQHTSQCSCSSDETQFQVPEPKHNSETASQLVTKHHDQQNQWNKQHQRDSLLSLRYFVGFCTFTACLLNREVLFGPALGAP